MTGPPDGSARCNSLARSTGCTPLVHVMGWNGGHRTPARTIRPHQHRPFGPYVDSPACTRRCAGWGHSGLAMEALGGTGGERGRGERGMEHAEDGASAVRWGGRSAEAGRAGWAHGRARVGWSGADRPVDPSVSACQGVTTALRPCGATHATAVRVPVAGHQRPGVVGPLGGEPMGGERRAVHRGADQGRLSSAERSGDGAPGGVGTGGRAAGQPHLRSCLHLGQPIRP